MALNDLTGQNIQDTYQKVVQTDGTNLADGTGSTLPISFNGNDVIISGSLTAQTYVVSESIINASSGSTMFGNDSSDTHKFTGSLYLANDLKVHPTFQIGPPGEAFAFPKATLSLNGDLYTNSHITASGNITSSGNIQAASALTGETLSITSGRINTTSTQIDFSGAPLNGITHLTASNNISSSGTITATNGFGIIDGGTWG
jgi:hypothetical protein